MACHLGELFEVGKGVPVGKTAKPLLPRVLFWLFIVCLLLYVATFIVDRFSEGGLLGAYAPSGSRALSEAQLVELESRLGGTFIVTQLLAWVRESAVGNFGAKPVIFLAMTLMLLAGWLGARTLSGRRNGAGKHVAVNVAAPQPPPQPGVAGAHEQSMAASAPPQEAGDG